MVKYPCLSKAFIQEGECMDDAFITVDLHGLRRDEAEKKIEKVLAEAGSGTYQIRLIHGFNRGTNLQEMIYDSFKYDKKIKRIIPGDNQGITILVLKELF
jgi:dsDNA-specific endonuclease/ATPase MutS2